MARANLVPPRDHEPRPTTVRETRGLAEPVVGRVAVSANEDPPAAITYFHQGRPVIPSAVGYHQEKGDDMPLFLCRWPNGDCSVVWAGTRHLRHQPIGTQGTVRTLETVTLRAPAGSDYFFVFSASSVANVRDRKTPYASTPAARKLKEKTMPSSGPVKKMNNHRAPDRMAGHG